MSTFDDFFRTQVDIPLYHYTGVSSLLGIVRGGSLWASSISYMNDAKEIIHACDTVEAILSRRLASGHESQEYRFLCQLAQWTKRLRHEAYPMFVFSLSEEPSLLSQWRSYTPHGKGVSIGFHAFKINQIASQSNMKIAKCIYDREEQEKLISALIKKLLESFRQELPNINVANFPPEQCYYGFIRQHANEIYQVLAIIKHGAFAEEREWRLISPHIQNFKDPRLQFREGASIIVPYIELSLGEKPFFKKIILGPSEHQNLSMSSLSMFMNNQGVCGTLHNCQIPYREW